MAVDAWQIASRLVLVATLACLGVLAVRGLLRRRFGARVAYASWLAVPCALAAALLPAPVASPVRVLLPLQRIVGEAAPAMAAPFDARPWLAAAWLLGALATAAVFVSQQRRYVRNLGRLRRLGRHVARSSSTAGGPALVGAWRPRIVVPADFNARYGARERALILAHERVHLARGDALANAAIAVLRCLAWFDPVIHWAAARFRHDQELACDAMVIERFPEARAAYADAMLKTQLAEQARQELRLPAGCRWPSRHPFTERILMLGQVRPSRARRAAGLTLVTAFGLAGAIAAWAAQAPRPERTAHVAGTQVDARLDVAVDGETLSQLRLVGALGQSFAVDSSDAARPWHAEFVADSVRGGIELAATITRDGAVVAQPVIVVAEGEPGSIQVGRRGEPGYFRLDATLFLRAPGWRADGDVTGDAAADRAASEDISYRVNYPPVYPPAAIAARQSGHVDLRVAVDAQGHPRSADVARADPPEAAAAFGDASIAAVMNWSFNPALEHGRAVAGEVMVPIDFRLDDD